MLGHAQSSPIGEGRDRLEGDDESREAIGVEAPVPVPDQLERHRVNPRLARVLARREPGELPVVAGREVVPHRPGLGVDEVEVVEEPLRGRRHGLAGVDVVREDAVDLPEDAQVLVQPGQHVVPARRSFARA